MPGPLKRKERRAEGKGNEGRGGEERMHQKEMCGVAAVHCTLAKGAKTTCSSSTQTSSNSATNQYYDLEIDFSKVSGSSLVK